MIFAVTLGILSLVVSLISLVFLIKTLCCTHKHEITTSGQQNRGTTTTTQQPTNVQGRGVARDEGVVEDTLHTNPIQQS